MADLTQEQIIERGERAQRIIQDDLFKEAIANLKAYYTDQMLHNASADEREEARKYYLLTEGLEEKFRSAVTEAKFVQGKLDNQPGHP